MENLKKFVGEKAYNIIKNITVDSTALHKALVTPQNARAVFADLSEFEIKSLCAGISCSDNIGQARDTTQEEIISCLGIATTNTHSNINRKVTFLNAYIEMWTKADKAFKPVEMGFSDKIDRFVLSCVRELSELFHVSLQAARIRLEKLNVVKFVAI